MPIPWIERVMRAESGGRTDWNGGPIRSVRGAIGLMQLMPATWDAMRARARLGLNPDDPHDNIMGGTLYLRLLYERFGYPGLFSAYNAGPARYAAYLNRRRPLPAETIAYLRGLGVVVTQPNAMTVLRPSRPTATSDGIFVAFGPGQNSQLPATTEPASTIFAIRKAVP